MGPEEMRRVLTEGRVPIAELSPPSRPGVYAIFLKPGTLLPGLVVGPKQPIYLGTSDDLSARHLDGHLNSNNTGWSTLRRSLGAVLRHELKLRVLPRGGPDDTKRFQCYRFAPDGERRLTEWMVTSLEATVCAVEDRPAKEAERALIPLLEPLLCLNGWRNPYKPTVIALRKTCRAEARAAVEDI